jgi:hypothetical protein
MRTRTKVEVMERLRQLLGQHAKRLGLGPDAIERLLATAALEHWDYQAAIGDPAGGEAGVRLVVAGSAALVCPVRGRTVCMAFVPPGRFLPSRWGAASTVPLAIVRDRLGTIVAAWTGADVDAALASLSPAATRRFVAAAIGDAGHGMAAHRLLALGLRDRVLAALSALARDFGVRHPAGLLIDLRVTHADVASLAAGSRANVTRALEELRAKGLVLVDHLRFVVTTRGLEALDEQPTLDRWRACG